MKRAIQFDIGQTPQIACCNLATVPLGVDFAKLVAALQKYVDLVGSIWGVAAKLVIAKKAPVKGWQLLLLDESDDPGALGYHEMTPDGDPIMKIFVKTTRDDGELVSVTASHELAETILDGGCNLWGQHTDKENFAYELCDPVERSTFVVDGIAMSNFVYPSYFEVRRKPNSRKFDHLGLLKKPFTLLPGGYTIIQKTGVISQKLGSRAKGRKLCERVEQRKGGTR